MKIVIALDSFKGSCSAQAACAAVAQGLRRVDQTLELVEMPVCSSPTPRRMFYEPF